MADAQTAAVEEQQQQQHAAVTTPDILQELVLLLADDPLALARFTAVCTAWRDALHEDEVVGRELLKRRFGATAAAGPPPAAPPGAHVLGPWLHAFLRKARTHTNALSDTGCVVWGETTQYWGRVRDRPGSHAAEVMELRAVCWFDVSTTWKGVTQGTYSVVWRCAWRANQRSGGFERLKFDAVVEAARCLRTGAPLPADHPCAPAPEGGVPAVTDNTWAANSQYAELRVALEPQAAGAGAPVPRLVQEPQPEGAPRPAGLFHSRLELDQLQALSVAVPSNAWVDMEVGTFTVPPGVALDVKARFYDISGMWKSGLVLDTVSLVPADAAQRTAAQGRHAGASGRAPAAAGPAAAEQGWGWGQQVLGLLRRALGQH